MYCIYNGAYKYSENIVLLMKKRTRHQQTRYEIIRKREELVSEAVNGLLDKIYISTNRVFRQILEPVSGLNSDELQTLVRIVAKIYGENHPVLYTDDLWDVIVEAKKRGEDIPLDLTIKYLLLDEDEEVEVQYRVYALLEMKHILSEYFKDL